MNKLPSYFIGLMFLTSCSNQQTEIKAIGVQEVTTDSLEHQLLETHLNSRIAEPFQVSDIDALEFTSGRGEEVASLKKCDSSSTGFYGTYFLIDRDIAYKPGGPVGGTITIHSNKRMSDWKSTDINQTIWQIHLTSDVISVWDSVTVGLTRSQIEAFGKAHNGLCIKKGDKFYSCNFGNFSAVYVFQNDTLRELTVTRKCEQEIEYEY